MDIVDLGKMMVEHGLVIRGIPYFHEYKVEVRHKEKYIGRPNKYVEVSVSFDEAYGREMLRAKEKFYKGGKFVITQRKDQLAGIPNWGWGKPVVFYDSIEDAVAAMIKKIEPETKQ